MLWRAIPGAPALIPTGASRPSLGDALVADLSTSHARDVVLRYEEQAPWAPVVVLLGNVPLTPELAALLVGLRSPAAFLERRPRTLRYPFDSGSSYKPKNVSGAGRVAPNCPSYPRSGLPQALRRLA